MISRADVIKMYVPFPDIDSEIALNAHMYICLRPGMQKMFLKCQTFKPMHLIKGYPPEVCVVEDVNPQRNPFTAKTTIDCDKAFCINGVQIDVARIPPRMRCGGVCRELFDSIGRMIRHEDFIEETMEVGTMVRLNRFMRAV